METEMTEKKIMEWIRDEQPGQEAIMEKLKAFRVYHKRKGAASLAKMGKEMRRVQNEFFAGDKTVLKKSQRLEEKFDAACDLIIRTQS